MNRVPRTIRDLALARELRVQGGKCAGCRCRVPNGHGWCIDHDHGTGATRGVLCHNCNLILGLAHDDDKTLRRLGIYLRKWRDPFADRGNLHAGVRFRGRHHGRRRAALLDGGQDP